MGIELIGKTIIFNDTSTNVEAETATLAELSFGRNTATGALGYTVDGGATWTWLPTASGVTRNGATTDHHLAVWNGSSADSLEDGGEVPSGSGTPGDTVTDETTWGITPAAGEATEYSRADHTHGTPANPEAGSGYTQGARAHHSADQTFNADAYTAIAFNSEDFDTDTIHDNVTNNTRLTCKTAGKYLIIGNVYISTASATTRADIYIHSSKTSSDVAGAFMAGATARLLTTSTILDMDVNDYVELYIYNATGATATVKHQADYSPYFMMQRIG